MLAPLKLLRLLTLLANRIALEKVRPTIVLKRSLPTGTTTHAGLTAITMIRGKYTNVPRKNSMVCYPMT